MHEVWVGFFPKRPLLDHQAQMTARFHSRETFVVDMPGGLVMRWAWIWALILAMKWMIQAQLPCEKGHVTWVPLGGGFKCVLFSPLFGEDSHFD